MRFRTIYSLGRRVRWTGPPLFCISLGVSLLPAPAEAATHLANHLIISEVGYDSPTESGSTSSEYLEIYNPSDKDVSLNDGAVPGTANGKGSFFISDSPTTYYTVVNGKVGLGATTTDGVFQFPEGSIIPARGFVIVTADGDTFLKDFFASTLSLYTNLPGRPQVFETKQDGLADGMADMVMASKYGPTQNQNQTMNLTNGGESAILFYWDGKSDLVQDADIVTWISTTEAINKSGVQIDGPDSDSVISTYKSDAHQITSLGLNGASGTYSLQRSNLEENTEADTGGNGIGGHDESSELWATSNWVFTGYTPGMPLLKSDGSISDALSWLAPVAVSKADGANGSSSPSDYGADGTLTEFYMYSIDTDSDRQPDALYVALRGSLFGEPDSLDRNASLVLFDFDPDKKTGVQVLGGASSQLSDTSGTLDSRITNAGFTVNGSSYTQIGFDAAMGMDQSAPGSTDTAGWRIWGTGIDKSGSPGNFSYIGGTGDVKFDGNANTLYAAASGTSYAGEDGFEGAMSFNNLTNSRPEYVFAVAVTTADSGNGASPNTLPESTGDSFSDFPQVIDHGICFQTSTGKPVIFYVDQDLDGYGSQKVSAYCGPPIAGVSIKGGDCDDANKNINPGAKEVCDGIDNNCDGLADEGVLLTYYDDVDLDGYGDSNVTKQACATPAGYVAVGGDCDDMDAAVNPSALEQCDNIDNNCNGQTDDGLTQFTYYTDGDGDKYGTGTPTTDCDVPAGTTIQSGDCDDKDATSYPGAAELCDGKDNDCSGSIPADELDADNDKQKTCQGDCDDSNAQTYKGATEQCDGKDNDCNGALPANEADADKDGKATCAGDCNDADNTIYTGATEICDSKDNNCDGQTDEGVLLTFYQDSDHDAYGGQASLQACQAPAGYVTDHTDCNDGDATVYPGAKELCDEQDNNCDGQTDEGVTSTFHKDGDGDGYGSSESIPACTAPVGYVSDATDCDDSDNAVHPGAAEGCDGKDSNCDGALPSNEQDGDKDGQSSCAGDCNDSSTTIYTGATELCDGLDNDCDGSVPANESDNDSDGYTGCQNDCDDANKAVNPAAAEVCNGLDDDCNPATDEKVDGDGDGVALCPGASGAGDCNDANKDIYPGAEEICNDGVDDDCDPSTDENGDSDTDGFTICQGDCNDQSAAVNANALEACNSIDDNCDGQVDEGFDSDGDGDGYVTVDCDGDDCNDQDANIYPGAEESWYNGVDEDCDGQSDYDQDGDGFEELDAPDGGTDCDDLDDAVYPGAIEVCNDGIDNDCDIGVDKDDQDCAAPDVDGDGYTTDSDCDDNNASVNPGADEVCNDSLDNDCDGAVDAADSECESGDDDATSGDDDATSGDDDATSGDDDATSGDDDATSGDDDATSGDDDATSGDDDATSPHGDDDASQSGDDDTTSGGDDSAGCSCSIPAGDHPIPAGTLLLGLMVGGLMIARARRR